MAGTFTTPKGSYTVLGEVGLGAFSTVYRVATPSGEAAVAKVARSLGGSAQGTRVVGHHPARGYDLLTGGRAFRTLSSAEVDEVFRVEASLLRTAAGRRLPVLLDETVVSGRPLLVLQEHPSVWACASASALEFVEVLEALADLASSVGYHGDLKPEHVFRDALGQITFIDPGFRGPGDVGATTPAFDPFGLSGPVGDVVAVAVMLFLRYAGRVPDPAATIPPLASVSPAPVGVAEWVDALLRPASALPAWAQGHASAARELAHRLDRPIVESASHVLPRTRSQVTALVPPGWYVKQSWTLLSPDGQANVIVSSEPVSPNLDTTEYATTQGDLLRKEFAGFTEVRFEPFALGTHQQGYVREFEWTPPNGVRVRQLQIYYCADGRGYTATATTPAPGFERLRTTFESVLSSVWVTA